MTMLSAKAVLNFGLLVALLSVQQQLFSVNPAPVVGSLQDVELLDRDSAADGDIIIQGSMITPFPPVATGAANEPNFFWSGSGDDPDAGMTYWITTTVIKTTLVTLTPPPSTTTSTTVRIEPTPVVLVTTPAPIIDWPIESYQPEYWLRTVFRTDHRDEHSPAFRNLLQSSLKRLYSNFDYSIRLVNISRLAAADGHQVVEVVYALLSPESRQIVEPQAAVGSLRTIDVTRQLCHSQTGGDTQQDVLCQSIVTRAEPFANNTHQSTTYWIIGAALCAAVILILLIILLICYIQRKRQLKQLISSKVKEDRATSPVSATGSKIADPSGSNKLTKDSTKSQQMKKSAAPDLQRVDEDPEPLVRKARSTSKKKHGGKKKIKTSARPLTAPANHNSARQSCSSLSAVASGSSSMASSVEYRLPREEPIQVSRGARRLKHKSHRTNNINNNNDSLKSHEHEPRRPVPAPRRLLAIAVETETQEITADFSLTPDEEDSIDGESPVDRWRPGSLIPSCVSGAIFPSRKVSSAPGERPTTVESLARRAWVSSSPIGSSSIGLVNNSESNKATSVASIKPPPLHIHSISFPGLGIGDSDPAAELIRSIKQELKKFDHQVH